MIPDTRQRLEGALQDLTNYVVSKAMAPALHASSQQQVLQERSWLACCAIPSLRTGNFTIVSLECPTMQSAGRCGGTCSCYRGTEGCTGGNRGSANGVAISCTATSLCRFRSHYSISQPMTVASAEQYVKRRIFNPTIAVMSRKVLPGIRLM